MKTSYVTALKNIKAVAFKESADYLQKQSEALIRILNNERRRLLQQQQIWKTRRQKEVEEIYASEKKCIDICKAES